MGCFVRGVKKWHGTILMWNSSGGKGILHGITVCLRFLVLCDDLVVFKMRAGVLYLSFSIDTAPQ